MKEKIIDLLTESERNITVKEIANILLSNEPEVQNVLNELEKEYSVFKTKKNKYMLFSRNEYFRVGKLTLNKKGFGFVVNSNYSDDLYVGANNLNGAVDGDRVLVSVNKINNSGKIIRIIERILNNLVGEIFFKKSQAFVKLDDKRQGLTIIVKDPQTKNCVEGTKVKVSIVSEEDKTTYIAKIDKIIGHKNDPGVDIKSIALRFGFDDEFNEEVIKQIDLINNEVSDKDLTGREDLTNQVIFTIDGDDTKDIDDALSLEKNGDIYRLGVHIADVSYYVTLDSPLDKEALKRGTSAYLANSVIPMLPHKLSNGICSLNPDVVRLAMTCEMDIDSNGNVINYRIFDSIIKSRIQMTYKKVNDLLVRNIVAPEYEQFKDKLLLMNELAHILRKNKDQRGNLDFDIPEAKVLVNDTGETIDVVLRTREAGEILIEDFMIAANETVATHIFNKNLPFVYRTHEKPSPEKIDQFLSVAGSFGYTLKEKITNYEPKTIQKILNEVNELDNRNILSSLLLRSMRKALYTCENLGHFGLASTCYTHFTSPIRRYPDLIVHRLLRKYVINKDKNEDKFTNKLPYIAENSSLREQAAIEAEREVLDMKMAEYMHQHIGTKFSGVISGVTNFGFFVSLPNLIEGLVHMSTLIDDQYNYDEAKMVIAGINHGQIYRLGDKVDVIVTKADKESGEIDFELIKEGDKHGDKKSKSIL